MTQLTHEEAAEMKRRANKKPPAPGLNPLERAILGSVNGTRLEIPLADAVSLRKVADLIRGYAAELEKWSRMTEISERDILSHVQRLAADTNAKMRFAVYGDAKRQRGFKWDRK